MPHLSPSGKSRVWWYCVAPHLQNGAKDITYLCEGKYFLRSLRAMTPGKYSAAGLALSKGSGRICCSCPPSGIWSHDDLPDHTYQIERYGGLGMISQTPSSDICAFIWLAGCVP